MHDDSIGHVAVTPEEEVFSVKRRNFPARYSALRVRFVIAAHYNMERTKERLQRFSLLAERIGGPRLRAVFTALKTDVVATIHWHQNLEGEGTRTAQ